MDLNMFNNSSLRWERCKCERTHRTMKNAFQISEWLSFTGKVLGKRLIFFQIYIISMTDEYMRLIGSILSTIAKAPIEFRIKQNISKADKIAYITTIVLIIVARGKIILWHNKLLNVANACCFSTVSHKFWNLCSYISCAFTFIMRGALHLYCYAVCQTENERQKTKGKWVKKRRFIRGRFHSYCYYNTFGSIILFTFSMSRDAFTTLARENWLFQAIMARHSV